eukprot:8984186-Prorocentrum_lima.AAC.1
MNQAGGIESRVNQEPEELSGLQTGYRAGVVGILRAQTTPVYERIWDEPQQEFQEKRSLNK